ASITILNRTLSKAEQLVSEFDGLINMHARDYGSFDETEFDLIINGTSLSLTGELPELEKSVIAKNTCCYDMMYGIEDTVFVAWAKQNGAALALDGLGMLVEQAAVSFSIWRGVRPDTAPVIAALRS
ncbi:MAG: shikimate dehydrogenase, partial [Gammaproteobacteria bacterium]|nr:shikimate dehydrogenase [Gammaproteobacteria bacterium]